MQPPITATGFPSLASSGSETSVAYSRAIFGHPGTMIVQRNTGYNPQNAWDFSTDDGQSWNPCDVNTPVCGDGVAGVPMVPASKGLLACDILLGCQRFPQTSWDGDPQVAASIDGRTVVMANMSHSSRAQPSDNSDSIVVSSSIDGGQHFINTEFADPSDCYGYWEDQESLSADPTIPNRYWIAWRHRSFQLGFFGACARGFDVGLDGSFSWLAKEAPFPTAHPVFQSVGGMIIQARGDEVTVVYSNTGYPASNCDGYFGNVWLSVTSYDRGVTWPVTTTIDSSTLQWSCLPSTSPLVQTGLRDFAFVRDPGTGRLFAAIPEDDDIGFKIFESDDVGVSWQPRWHVGVDPAYTFFPTLGTDGRHIGASFQAVSTDASGSVAITTWFAGTPVGGSGFVAQAISGAYSPVGSGGVRSLGDYAGMATIPPGSLDPFTTPNATATFLPAWTQTAGGSSQVTAALVTVAP